MNSEYRYKILAVQHTSDEVEAISQLISEDEQLQELGKIGWELRSVVNMGTHTRLYFIHSGRLQACSACRQSCRYFPEEVTNCLCQGGDVD